MCMLHGEIVLANQNFSQIVEIMPSVQNFSFGYSDVNFVGRDAYNCSNVMAILSVYSGLI